MGKLAAAKLRHLGPGRHGDGDGLHLLVKPGKAPGTGAWVLRYQVAGRVKDMGLGAYPVVSLAEARTKAAEARSQAKAGAHPIQGRQATRVAAAAKGITFREAAEATVEAKKAGWSSPKHAAQWLATLRSRTRWSRSQRPPMPDPMC